MEMAATSSIAAWKAASFVFDGLLKPVVFLTNFSEAARTSSSVTGGSKLKRVLMFRHMGKTSVLRDQGAVTVGNPAPQTGWVTAIFSKPATGVRVRYTACFTGGKERDASWLARVSQTSVTQMVISSTASLETT